jgi:Flp pilus assembly protein TadB
MIKFKKVTICIKFTCIVFLMHILLADMLMCVIYVINYFQCIRYIHTDRQKKIKPKI